MKTALDWLEASIAPVDNNEFISAEKLRVIISQAKEYEREQILDAVIAATKLNFSSIYWSPEDYFNKTYNKNE